MINVKNRLFILSAPSGGGKTTVFERLHERLPHIRRVITATTRQPRKAENHGVDYYFYSPEEFERRSKEGQFVEEAAYAGHRYGTPRSELECGEGETVFLIIDVQGRENVIKQYPEATSVFLMPPSVEELKKRIRERGDNTPEEIERRIAAAEQEIACAKRYDHCVINDDLGHCVDEIAAIVNGTDI